MSTRHQTAERNHLARKGRNQNLPKVNCQEARPDLNHNLPRLLVQTLRRLEIVQFSHSQRQVLPPGRQHLEVNPDPVKHRYHRTLLVTQHCLKTRHHQTQVAQARNYRQRKLPMLTVMEVPKRNENPLIYNLFDPRSGGWRVKQSNQITYVLQTPFQNFEFLTKQLPPYLLRVWRANKPQGEKGYLIQQVDSAG